MGSEVVYIWRGVAIVQSGRLRDVAASGVEVYGGMGSGCSRGTSITEFGVNFLDLQPQNSI